MSDLPIDAIVACDAEVERLRARVAELEAECDRLQSLANVTRRRIQGDDRRRHGCHDRGLSGVEGV